MKIDLHCHTTLSDGSLGIEEVIAQAKKTGIDVLSITDHDTLSSYSRAAVLADRYGPHGTNRETRRSTFSAMHLRNQTDLKASASSAAR